MGMEALVPACVDSSPRHNKEKFKAGNLVLRFVAKLLEIYCRGAFSQPCQSCGTGSA